MVAILDEPHLNIVAGNARRNVQRQPPRHRIIALAVQQAHRAIERNLAIQLTERLPVGPKRMVRRCRLRSVGIGLDDRPAMVLGMSELKLFKRVAIDFKQRKVLFDLPPGTAWYNGGYKGAPGAPVY